MSLNYNHAKKMSTNPNVNFYSAKEKRWKCIKILYKGKIKLERGKKMKRDMIVKIEEYLDKLQQKPIRVSQNGFLINQFFMEKMMYKVQNDTLNLRDETKEIYLSLNLNQVYQIEIGENKMILFLDNDTEIQVNS